MLESDDDDPGRSLDMKQTLINGKICTITNQLRCSLHIYNQVHVQVRQEVKGA